MRRGLGIALLVLATGVCVVLGTLGWFVVGFGLLTDCTNNYGCTTTGCEPCEGATRWVNAGGVAQWVLAATAVVLLVRGVRSRRAQGLVLRGLLVVAVSVATLAVTTWRADESYCRPGTPGYAASYCPAEL